MRLTQPTDFEILAALDEYGLVNKVGPAESSGLYELTDRGQAALNFRDSYEQLGPNRFQRVVDDAVGTTSRR